MKTSSWFRGEVDRTPIGNWIWKHGASGGLVGAILRGNPDEVDAEWKTVLAALVKFV